MSSDTHNAVVGLIAEFTGYDSSWIQGSTRLMEDLGVDGDDAAELLQEFASRFKVDLSRFEFQRHFGPEAGWNPIAAAYYLVVGSELEPISVKQLVEAAERGAWR